MPVTVSPQRFEVGEQRDAGGMRREHEPLDVGAPVAGGEEVGERGPGGSDLLDRGDRIGSAEDPEAGAQRAEWARRG